MPETSGEYKELGSESRLLQVYNLLYPNSREFVARFHQGKVRIEARHGDVRYDKVPENLIKGLADLGIVPTNSPKFTSGWIVVEMDAPNDEIQRIRKMNLPCFLLY